MENSVKRICLNCSRCISYAKNRFMCDAYDYRDVLPFNEACGIFIELTPEEKQAQKELHEMFPGVYKDGELDFFSPDFDKLIDYLRKKNNNVYCLPCPRTTYWENVDDSILTTITEDAIATIQDNATDFKETVQLLSNLFLTGRKKGLLSLLTCVKEYNDDPPIIMKEYISNVVENIIEGIDPDKIVMWSIDEYEKIPEDDEYRKFIFSFSYMALQALQGGHKIKALRLLCWKYVPIELRLEIDTMIEKVKDEYK